MNSSTISFTRCNSGNDYIRGTIIFVIRSNERKGEGKEEIRNKTMMVRDIRERVKGIHL